MMKKGIFFLFIIVNVFVIGANSLTFGNVDYSGIDTSLDYYSPTSASLGYQTFFKPVNAETGDPMPYYNESERMYYVYFLLGNFSGYPKGGIYRTKTKDFAQFQPVLSQILTGEGYDIDSHIGAGSAIKKGKSHYFFYTGFNNSPNPSIVTKAVLEDLSDKWLKEQTFIINAPEGYDKGEFRDPHVYWDETRNKYVMLVGSRNGGKATIARFQSDDLDTWQQIEGIAATTSNNPKIYEVETDTWIAECPDIFKMGDKWYLVFSRLDRDDHRKTFYRIADNPNGPWRKCSDEKGHHETFDGLYLYAAKTVSDGTNRYVSGWASSGQERQSNGELHWGGMLVTHKLIQQANGKLYPTVPDAVNAKFSKAVEYKDIKQIGSVSGNGNNFTLQNGGKVVFNRNVSSVKIEMKIDASQAQRKFGIAFGAHDNQSDTYNLTFDLSNSNKYNTPALFMSHYDKEYNFTPLIVPENKQFDVKIIIERQVCVMYVNGNVAFTNHISNMEQNPWMIFADEGVVKFSDIKIFKQDETPTSGQNLVISNGEDIGVNWWKAGSTNVEIVDWHPKDGNSTNKAMTIWISKNSDVWSGGGLGGLNIDVNAYNTISMLVYKNVAGTVRLELQDGDGENNKFFVSADYNSPGTWQKLEFPFPSEMKNIKTLLIAPFIDYDLSTIVGEQSRCFWDEVEATYKIRASENVLFENDEIVSSQIYSINGTFLGTFNEIEQRQQLPKGIYIIKSTRKNGRITVSKMYNTK